MELDFHTARALLDWQIELGADEAIGDVSVNRYDLPESAPKPVARRAAAAAPAPVAAPPVVEAVDAVAEARHMAGAATDLAGLQEAMAAFPHCDLKRGARRLVFSDGDPAARVMIIGEAPGRDEDIQGKPFVGRAGQLLDRMFDAIGMGRDREGGAALYITNILPWRPPQNRDPNPKEMAMMLPFVTRHVALAAPDILVLMGNISCQGILGRKGITRMRGQWTEGLDKPVLPMFHPAYLLRNPVMKRESWADLLTLKVRLGEREHI
ncbi:uracil-DNA glycosylase [Rhodophyticola sp. CCM32]|uniref:uracil-DNA glycosylase n=1 Tax=Rhodophyticola sp. CCM32 TaxID=2916397 RepID=UPI00107F7DF8|nr:uracil-DNA glycosylase [Rhodophyticola sp. CCM32]QBY01710.1 uracil-DNA glycosylase [Rhodophyticola sp. CCM32]